MISVQKATSNDANGIVYVHQNTWLSTYPNESEGITRTDILEKTKTFTKEGWEKRLKPDAGKRIAIAKSNDQIVGFAVGLNEEKQTKIGAIYVLKTHQHLGIGTRLIEELLSWLPDDKPCTVHVVSYNKPAISFYHKHGFEFLREENADEWLHFPSGNILKGVVLKRPEQP